MTRDDIIRIAAKADDLTDAALGSEWNPDRENLRDIHFAALVAAEKEQQMISNGWRKCAEGQRTTQFCGLLDTAVKAEREACVELCLEHSKLNVDDANAEFSHLAAYEFGKQVGAATCATAIKARGEV